MRPDFQRETYYGILRVHAEKDGRVTPLWYGVGDAARWEQMTVVDRHYMIAFCVLHAPTYELACRELKESLNWFKDLLGGAKPEGAFLEEVGKL